MYETIKIFEIENNKIYELFMENHRHISDLYVPFDVDIDKDPELSEYFINYGAKDGELILIQR